MIDQDTAIILINTQMGENIGAAARVMKNFGFHDLRIVTPKCQWPNEKATAMSVSASDLINNAKICDSLSDALIDIQYLFATSVRPRDMIKPIISSQELPEHIPSNLKSAILFGGEKSGLSNNEIAIADKIITINTNPDCSSLNLAQSVALICYELQRSEINNNPKSHNFSAPKSQIISMLGQLTDALDGVNYFRADSKRDAMIEILHNMFTKIPWDEQEIRTFRGVIRSFNNHNNQDKNPH